MRIAIDTRRIGDFGVGTYIRNVVRTLGRIDCQNEYLLIGPAEPLREIGGLPSNFLNEPYSLPDTSPRNYFKFQDLLRRFRCDVLHVPQLFSSPQYIPCPYVVTVHDLLDHFYPPQNESSTRRSLRFYFTRRVLRRAGRIFAVSNSTRNDIGRLFHIPLGHVEVIHNAIDEGFRLGPFYDIVAPSVYPRFRRTGLALKITPGTNPHSMSDIGPKHLALLAKSFGLNNAVLQVAVSDLKRQLGAAQETIRESQVGSTTLKKQLIDLMGKRWNGTFASIGK